MYRYLAIALTVALAACASDTTKTSSSQPREEKEFRTGSRIPVRDTAPSASPTTTAEPNAARSGTPTRTN